MSDMIGGRLTNTLPLKPRPEHANCIIERYPHRSPHRGYVVARPCGHFCCDTHAMIRFGVEPASPDWDSCMYCYGTKYPDNCPDPTLRTHIRESNGEN